MNKFSTKDPEFPCGTFPPKWNKPITEKMAADYESKHGITLPSDYRKFITTVTDGCTQPFYGLYSLYKSPENSKDVAVNEKFPYTIEQPLDIFKLFDEEYDAIYETEEINIDAGFLFLCHEGYGMYSILIVNTDDENTYGTVWYYDLANDAGIFPLTNPKNNSTMNFLDWLEYYVGKTLELDDSDYFSYTDLIKFEEN